MQHQSYGNGCPVPQSGTGRYKCKGNAKGAQLKLAATLRFGTAESQDESPCGAIHKVKSFAFLSFSASCRSVEAKGTLAEGPTRTKKGRAACKTGRAA